MKIILAIGNFVVALICIYVALDTPLGATKFSAYLWCVCACIWTATGAFWIAMHIQ